MKSNFHRALGVYAVSVKNEAILVIHKGGGPYVNRYDLPGGSLEEGESLAEALVREVKEETGLRLQRFQQIGAVDFRLPWSWKTYTHVHHTAIFYEAEVSGELHQPEAFAGQDARAAAWIPLQSLKETQCSPLVWQAVSWYKHSQLPLEAVDYSEWEIK